MRSAVGAGARTRKPTLAAVKAVTAMVKGPSTRAAAMTILGKLTELCADKVRDQTDPALLHDLQAALLLVRWPSPLSFHHGAPRATHDQLGAACDPCASRLRATCAGVFARLASAR